MERRKLVEMYKDCILELFNESENISGEKMHFNSFDELIGFCKISRNLDGCVERKLPFMCFYVDEEKQDSIIKKYTDKCKRHWIYPHKIKLNDEKFDNYMKDLEKFEKEKSNLSKWFRKKRREELIKKYGLQYRSREGESLAFEIFNIAPTSHIENFNIMKNFYLRHTSIPEKFREDIEDFKHIKRMYDHLRRMES